MTKNERENAAAAIYVQFSKMPDVELRVARHLYKHMADFLSEEAYLAIIDDILDRRAGPVAKFLTAADPTAAQISAAALMAEPNRRANPLGPYDPPNPPEADTQEVFSMEEMQAAGLDGNARITKPSRRVGWVPGIFQDAMGGKK